MRNMRIIIRNRMRKYNESARIKRSEEEIWKRGGEIEHTRDKEGLIQYTRDKYYPAVKVSNNENYNIYKKVHRDEEIKLRGDMRVWERRINDIIMIWRF
jgi:hypothetical protein